MERIKQVVRSKSYRGGQGADGREIFIFSIQTGKILSFKAAEIMCKFRFELARDDCADASAR